MTKRDKLFKMLGFPVKMDVAPVVEVTVAKTRKNRKPKADKDEQ